MLIFDIITAGCESRSIWRGRVHSVFENAINILANNTLHTILFNPLWVSETNIITDKAIAVHIDRADIICSDGDYLYAGTAPIASFKNSVCWQMPEISGRKVTLESVLKIKSVLDTVKISDITAYVGNAFTECARRFISGENADFTEIIGAGQGLTPTGDDMLTGFALALLCERPADLARLSMLCTPLLTATTDISNYLLAEAFRGKFAAPLVSLLLSMQTGRGLDEAVEIALNIGSSSGRDGIFGLYTGLILLADG